MDWARWEPLYEAILADFGFDRAADEQARDWLDEALAPHQPVDHDALRAATAGREAWIVGGAATPEDMRLVPEGAPLFVADAAAPVALRHASPTALVTDLDGDIALQAAVNAMGVPVFVHAHGDNLATLREHLPAFRGPLAGTTQAAPAGRARNFGGFTDGDRACCLAEHLGATSLALVGFDFDRPAAKAGRDPETKRRKLQWARRIVEGLGLPVRHVVSESIQRR